MNIKIDRDVPARNFHDGKLRGLKLERFSHYYSQFAKNHFLKVLKLCRHKVLKYK